ncbi:hypothetical protein KJ652_00995 [Patescibacteria group bacterium]|nr:hypothetical protein [Patescibacteria group bacterium]MBU1123147.1 hypothetical protein [Patescibacteria group bacterium]
MFSFGEIFAGVLIALAIGVLVAGTSGVGKRILVLTLCVITVLIVALWSYVTSPIDSYHRWRHSSPTQTSQPAVQHPPIRRVAVQQQTAPQPLSVATHAPPDATKIVRDGTNVDVSGAHAPESDVLLVVQFDGGSRKLVHKSTKKVKDKPGKILKAWFVNNRSVGISQEIQVDPI